MAESSPTAEVREVAAIDSGANRLRKIEEFFAYSVLYSELVDFLPWVRCGKRWNVSRPPYAISSTSGFPITSIASGMVVMAPTNTKAHPAAFR